MKSCQGKIDYLAIAEILTQRSDWNQALDDVLVLVKSAFIFDNLAIFISEKEARSLSEIVLHCSSDNEHFENAENGHAELLEIAKQVTVLNNVILTTSDLSAESLPSFSGDQKKADYARSFLLGLPLRTAAGFFGAMVFVRHNGPTYTTEQIQNARYIASQFACFFERKKLTQDIRALEEIQRLMALQDDLIATISHELRTPLGFIKGYSTTLLRDDTRWDRDTQREFLTIIDEEADHLSSLIENVLDSARLQNNTLPMKFHANRLDTLIVETAARAQARSKEMVISFDFAVRPVVQIDSFRIAQVFNNLFTNAEKYAPGAPLSISIHEIPGFFHITFADSGPGIQPEHLPFLMNRFYRVPGQGNTGSGMGLFICNRIIDAHGGKMSVESEPGHGTVFIIDLPVETLVGAGRG